MLVRRVAIAIILSACTSAERRNLTGFVNIVTEGADGQHPAFGYAVASFDAPDVRAPTVRSFGACDVFTYDVPTTYSSAGVIMINAGLTGVELVPGSNGRYDPVTGDYQFFQGGETLAVHAHGGDVPTFNTMLPAPGQITITSPPPATDAMSNVAVPRGQPLEMQWTGTTSAVRLLVYLVGDANGQNDRVVCRFPGVAGSGTVPAEALATVDAGTPVQFVIDAANDTAVTAADWDVEVTASLDAYWTPTQLAQGNFVFQ